MGHANEMVATLAHREILVTVSAVVQYGNCNINRFSEYKERNKYAVVVIITLSLPFAGWAGITI